MNRIIISHKPTLFRAAALLHPSQTKSFGRNISNGSKFMQNGAKLTNLKNGGFDIFGGNGMKIATSEGRMFRQSAAVMSNLGSFGSAIRMSSTLIDALNHELQEAEAAETDASTESISNILRSIKSPFEVALPAGAQKGKQNITSNLNEIILKNGNVVVTFSPTEFEHSGETHTAVPFSVHVSALNQEKEKLTLHCVARRNSDTEEGELELEDIAVEPVDEEFDDDLVYSPKIGELSEELKMSLFEYLVDRGVDNEFASAVALIAEVAEEELYKEWVRKVRDFVVTESK